MLRFDIFCRVIDNWGDAGVCWRLCQQLAQRGHAVRFIIDQPEALSGLAPDAHTHIRLVDWNAAQTHANLGQWQCADVVIEAFACTLPDAVQAHIRHDTVWINLEYLSAERYVERCHRLASPVLSGAATGRTKWFFYPGFTPSTGGPLRNLSAQPRAGQATPSAHSAPLRIGLFCYEPAALKPLLWCLSGSAVSTEVLVFAGRGAQAVQTLLAQDSALAHAIAQGTGVRLRFLQLLSQAEFDQTLHTCQLNFVRGEDSWAQAHWTGQPFIWQAYQQSDNAHAAKLQAWLDWLGADASYSAATLAWNGLSASTPADWQHWLSPANISAWQHSALAARTRLHAQDDLCTQLLHFVLSKRSD